MNGGNAENMAVAAAHANMDTVNPFTPGSAQQKLNNGIKNDGSDAKEKNIQAEINNRGNNNGHRNGQTSTSTSTNSDKYGDSHSVNSAHADAGDAHNKGPQSSPERKPFATIQKDLPFGGPRGNGSTFVMEDAEYAKLYAQEQKYYALTQNILNLAGITINGNKPYDIVIYNPLTCRRVIQKGSLGLGEAYMEGWWDTRDFYALDTFIQHILQGGIEYYFPNNAKDILNILKARLFNAQSKTRSKKVGLQHYDIGNGLFEEMLGKYMQYSCAYWVKHDGGPHAAPTPITTLEEAQEQKLIMIAEKLRLKPGMEVLDVGCGWGTLAQFLSERYAVKVTGITISEEQRKSAAELVKEDSNVTILFQDYRDAKFDKKFDRIVSVGMFEHVGPKNYTAFFKHMRRLLRDDDPEAVLLLHTIGSLTTMSSADQWYCKYIFPGGCLPSLTNIGKSIEQLFVMEDLHNFGHFYNLTLLEWRKRFLKYWMKSDPPAPEKEKEDSDVFFRMFFYYLSTSAGAFLARDLQLWQMVLSPKGIPGYPNVYRP